MSENLSFFVKHNLVVSLVKQHTQIAINECKMSKMTFSAILEKKKR